MNLIQVSAGEIINLDQVIKIIYSLDDEAEPHISFQFADKDRHPTTVNGPEASVLRQKLGALLQF